MSGGGLGDLEPLADLHNGLAALRHHHQGVGGGTDGLENCLSFFAQHFKKVNDNLKDENLNWIL